MSRKHHELKTDPEPFAQTWQGSKPWEFRKNDRDFKEGDTVVLRELSDTVTCNFCGRVYSETESLCLHCASFDNSVNYSGREITGTIEYVLLEGYGVPVGFCIFTFLPTERRVFDQSGNKIIL